MEEVSMLKKGNQDKNICSEEGNGDAEIIDGELMENISKGRPSPLKRGRGRPKKLKQSDEQVLTTGVDTESGLDSENGSPIPTHKERGRPKGSAKKHIAYESVGVDQETGAVTANNGRGRRSRGRPKGSGAKKYVVHVSSEEGSGAETSHVDHQSPKRGRPKIAISKKQKMQRISAACKEDAGENSSSSPPKKGRGGPKGSVCEELKAASSDDDSRPMPLKKRGRPKGSFPKPVILKECSVRIEELDVSNGNLTPPKRGRGRPKCSDAKEAPRLKVYGKPKKMGPLPSPKPGRPRKVNLKRGRPRKYPLPSEEDNEINKTKKKLKKVWKTLGRPRIYPRIEHPTAVTPTERRGRGRPRKNVSKKGAHLRKNNCARAMRSRFNSPAKNAGDVPRKRGRPKCSVEARHVDRKEEPDVTPHAKRIRQSNGRDTLTQGTKRGQIQIAAVSDVGEKDEEENGRLVQKENMDEEQPECISQMVEDADESEPGFAPLEESDLSVKSELAMN